MGCPSAGYGEPRVGAERSNELFMGFFPGKFFSGRLLLGCVLTRETSAYATSATSAEDARWETLLRVCPLIMFISTERVWCRVWRRPVSRGLVLVQTIGVIGHFRAKHGNRRNFICSIEQNRHCGRRQAIVSVRVVLVYSLPQHAFRRRVPQMTSSD